MRIVILIALMVAVTVLKAQTFMPGSFFDNTYRGGFANNIHLGDSSYKKKWSLSRYGGMSTSFTFFKGGNATIVSAPIGLQLNRRLNNNLYAFTSLSVAPAYISFNRSFMNTDFNKANQNNAFLRSNSIGMYSRAELGLQYVNDERTFSISGSIGVERSNNPMLQYNQVNNYRKFPAVSGNR